MRYKHGMRNTRLYNIWRSMKQRCYNHNSIGYKNYGGKGILVCDEWLHDFKLFYKWSMANGYSENMTIDRKNTNGNYEPSNCRWVTQRVQQNNRTNNRFIEFNGESHTLGEWSEITGISLGTIWNRLKLGWTIEKTLTTKPFKGRNQYNT